MKEYEVWSKENEHLPNLQPSEQIISRMQAQRDRIKPDSGKAITPELEARFQRIEQKLDKLVRHLGVN